MKDLRPLRACMGAVEDIECFDGIWQDRDLPTRYRLLKLHAPDDLVVEHVAANNLPADWLERTDFTRASGDRWLRAGGSPLLRVPSAVVPEAFNVLLNPGHEHAGQVGVVQLSEHAIDPRILK